MGGLSPAPIKTLENLKGLTMPDFLKPVLRTSHSGHTLPRKGPGEEAEEDEEGLELPVNPDEGTPLIPDEEGEVDVPS